MAGRLRNFLQNWKRITSDPVVLSWINGYKIPFISSVYQNNPPKERVWTTEEFSDISKQINKLILKGIIQECLPVKDQFISRIFLIPKTDGSNRLIINLKELNGFIDPVHFKLEDGRTVLKLLFKHCLMSSIDIKDAYYLIPIHKNYRKYLRFYFNKKILEFTCLPFGLCTAPFVFTKIMKPIISSLRRQGLTLVIYLDDIMIIARSISECATSVKLLISYLSSLGFLVNKEKS